MRWSRRAGSVMLGALPLLFACSNGDEVTSPQFKSTIAKVGTATGDDTISDYDADGTLWTLHTNTGLLTSGDSIEITLDGPQAAHLANAMIASQMNTVDYIQARLPNPSQCDGSPSNPCLAYRGFVDNSSVSLSRSANDQEATATSRKRSHWGVTQASVRAAFSSMPTQPFTLNPSARRHSISPSAMSGSTSGFDPNERRGDVLSVSGDPMSCLSIATSIYNAMPAWRDAREAYKQAYRNVFGDLHYDPMKGKWTLKGPNPEGIVALDVATVELKEAQTRLNVMAVEYNMNGCQNNLWPDASSNPTVALFSNSSQGDDYRCTWEPWDFIVGDEVKTIQVEVCQFVNVI